MDDRMKKEMNVTMFEENVWLCERTQELLRSIEESRKSTVVYRDADLRMEEEREEDAETRKVACSVQMFEDWMAHKRADSWLGNKRGRFGIVCFGSAYYPGGAVMRGESGSEEYLCRQSTLYPCLNSEFVRKEYYEKNLYGRDMCGVKRKGTRQYLYIPNLVCTEQNCKDDIWWKYGNCFDVIYCSKENEYIDSDVANICTVARRHKIDGLIFLLDKDDYLLEGKELEYICSHLR